MMSDERQPLVDQTFTKYADRGAYHWLPWYRRSLQESARYEVALRLLAENLELEEATGLDAGCGDGRFLYHVRRNGGRIFGLDISQEGLSLARQKLSQHGLQAGGLVSASGYRMPFGDGTLDYVVGLEVIEHLVVPGRLLCEIGRVLKDGGILFLSTPNRREGQTAREVRDPFHAQEFVSEELRQMLVPRFQRVDIYGGNPEWLVNILSRWGGQSIIGKLWRGMVRGVCRSTANPLVSRLSEDPDRRWESLYVLCRGPQRRNRRSVSKRDISMQ